MNFNKINKKLTNSHNPIGYILDKKENRFLIDEDSYLIVQRIFQERYAGASLRQIANGLLEDNLSSEKCSKWQAFTIKKILQNIQYLGYFQEGNILIKNTHIPIIKEEIFLSVNNFKCLSDYLEYHSIS